MSSCHCNIIGLILLAKKNFRLGYLGLEPRTNRLKADYSTIELATLNKHQFSFNIIHKKFFNKKNSNHIIILK